MQAIWNKKKNANEARKFAEQFNALSYNTGHHCMMRYAGCLADVFAQHIELIWKFILIKIKHAYKKEKRNLSPQLTPISNYLFVKLHGEFLPL